MEDFISSKISDFLDKKYSSLNEDKKIDLLGEQEENEYKKCFKLVLQQEDKSIAEMTDGEKGKFFKKVKEKCSKK